MHHHQCENREYDELRIDITIEPACALLPLNCGAEHADLVEGNVSDQARSQGTVLVEHLANPNRGNPGRPFDPVQEAGHDAANEIRRWASRWNMIPDAGNDGTESLIDNGIEKALAVLKVVMHHRGRKPGPLCYHGEGRSSDTMLSEQLKGGDQQLVAGFETSG